MPTHKFICPGGVLYARVTDVHQPLTIETLRLLFRHSGDGDVICAFELVVDGMYGVEAYIQFGSRWKAVRGRAALDGHAIYDGSCYLAVELIPPVYTTITTPDELPLEYFYDDTPYAEWAAALATAERHGEVPVSSDDVQIAPEIDISVSSPTSCSTSDPCLVDGAIQIDTATLLMSDMMPTDPACLESSPALLRAFPSPGHDVALAINLPVAVWTATTVAADDLHLEPSRGAISAPPSNSTSSTTPSSSSTSNDVSLELGVSNKAPDVDVTGIVALAAICSAACPGGAETDAGVPVLFDVGLEILVPTRCLVMGPSLVEDALAMPENNTIVIIRSVTILEAAMMEIELSHIQKATLSDYRSLADIYYPFSKVPKVSIDTPSPKASSVSRSRDATTSLSIARNLSQGTSEKSRPSNGDNASLRVSQEAANHGGPATEASEAALVMISLSQPHDHTCEQPRTFSRGTRRGQDSLLDQLQKPPLITDSCLLYSVAQQDFGKMGNVAVVVSWLSALAVMRNSEVFWPTSWPATDIGGSGHVIHWCKLLGQSTKSIFMLFLPGPFCCTRVQPTRDALQSEPVEILFPCLPLAKPPETYGTFGTIMAPDSRLCVIILRVPAVWSFSWESSENASTKFRDLLLPDMGEDILQANSIAICYCAIGILVIYRKQLSVLNTSISWSICFGNLQSEQLQDLLVILLLLCNAWFQLPSLFDMRVLLQKGLMCRQYPHPSVTRMISYQEMGLDSSYIILQLQMYKTSSEPVTVQELAGFTCIVAACETLKPDFDAVVVGVHSFRQPFSEAMLRVPSIILSSNLFALEIAWVYDIEHSDGGEMFMPVLHLGDCYVDYSLEIAKDYFYCLFTSSAVPYMGNQCNDELFQWEIDWLLPMECLHEECLFCSTRDAPTYYFQLSQWINTWWFSSVSAVLVDSAGSDFGEGGHVTSTSKPIGRNCILPPPKALPIQAPNLCHSGFVELKIAWLLAERHVDMFKQLRIRLKLDQSMRCLSSLFLRLGSPLVWPNFAMIQIDKLCSEDLSSWNYPPPSAHSEMLTSVNFMELLLSNMARCVARFNLEKAWDQCTMQMLQLQWDPGVCSVSIWCRGKLGNEGCSGMDKQSVKKFLHMTWDPGGWHGFGLRASRILWGRDCQ